MPRVSQAHLDARRQQILDAASACFAREGFHRTTMQQIIEESGLSAGAIYSYFKSKEDMIEAIGAARHARERDLILAASAEPETAAALRHLMQRFFELLADPAEHAERRLAMQLWSEALRNPRVLRTVRQGVDAPRALLAELVRKARARGDLPRRLDPDATARAMIALYQGFVLQLAWDPSIDTAAYVRTIETILTALSDSARRKPPGEPRVQS